MTFFTLPQALSIAATNARMTTAKKSLLNALTVDLEDFFHVSAFDQKIARNDWSCYPSRIQESTEKLLQIFADADVSGTFFVLGWVADKNPKLVDRIANAGHEIASHGYWHHLVYKQTHDEFRKDILRSRDAIGQACGVNVTAYRAPSFSITAKSLWALNILAEEGFTLDSSIFPIAGHDRYGVPDATKEIHSIETCSGTILEFPPSAATFGPIDLPIGGGYFRLFPLWLTRAAIQSVQAAGRPAMFYTHPWEYDPEQPRVGKLKTITRFRHYVSLAKSTKRLTRLLENCNFATISEVVRCHSDLQELQGTDKRSPPTTEASR